jgi:hypothetical protein
MKKKKVVRLVRGIILSNQITWIALSQPMASLQNEDTKSHL